MSLVIGIDPGLKGGIAKIWDDGVESIPMPIKEGLLDIKTLFAWVEPEITQPMDTVVYIERVWAMPKQRGGERFIKDAGRLLGLFELFDVTPIEVLPKKWKHGILKAPYDKDAAIAYCDANFPEISLLATPRSKKPHDGMADALCIAAYGRLCEEEKA